jgi:hypothetical protein
VAGAVQLNEPPVPVAVTLAMLWVMPGNVHVMVPTVSRLVEGPALRRMVTS